MYRVSKETKYRRVFVFMHKYIYIYNRIGSHVVSVLTGLTPVCPSYFAITYTYTCIHLYYCLHTRAI